MRLDKFLSETGCGSRSDVKRLLKRGLVTVNDHPEKNGARIIDASFDRITMAGRLLRHETGIYLLLNKSKGTVCARKDHLHPTVMDGLPREILRRNPFPVGRLDIDTEGLLLITDDGPLCHDITAPGKNVTKTYLVTPVRPVTDAQINALSEGVLLQNENYRTRPAICHLLADGRLSLTITEGKFHQVKRMMLAVGNAVASLQRIAIGGLTLPPDLSPGEYRRMTKEDLLRDLYR